MTFMQIQGESFFMLYFMFLLLTDRTMRKWHGNKNKKVKIYSFHFTRW